MRHNRLAAVAVTAGGGANVDAQIEQIQRVRGKESGELHVGRLSGNGTWQIRSLGIVTTWLSQ